MSVTNLTDARKHAHPDLQNCFLCGATFDHYEDGDVVFWLGDGGGILLCPACALHLGTHLIMDARSVQHRQPRAMRLYCAGDEEAARRG